MTRKFSIHIGRALCARKFKSRSSPGRLLTHYSSLSFPSVNLEGIENPLTSFSVDSHDIFSKHKKRTISALRWDRDVSPFQIQELGSTVKKAAVLVSLCHDLEGHPGLLCTVRAASLKTHKGDICFPGGLLEATDDSPVTTALRESQEELGIPPEVIDVWTTCRPIPPTPWTPMFVVPVVGLIKSPMCSVHLQPNGEVDRALILRLSDLCAPSNWRELTAQVGGTSLRLPIFDLSNGDLGPSKFWGLSALVAHLVLSALLPEQYKRNIAYLELIRQEHSEEKQRSLITAYRKLYEVLQK